MAELWYYTHEGRRMEPVPTDVVQELARAGSLKPTDMVWREGMPRWTRASTIAEIFPDPFARLEQALSAPSINPQPAAPLNILPPAAMPDAPVLLEVSEDTALTNSPAPERRPKRLRRTDEIELDISRRLPRRDRRTQTLALAIGLLVAGAALLLVLVLGLLYIALGAL